MSKGTRSSGSQRGEARNNIEEERYSRGKYGHASKCRKLFYILLRSRITRPDREHVITLRTRDKRYLSSNFLALSANACANLSTYLPTPPLQPHFPTKPSQPRWRKRILCYEIPITLSFICIKATMRERERERREFQHFIFLKMKISN